VVVMRARNQGAARQPRIADQPVKE